MECVRLNFLQLTRIAGIPDRRKCMHVFYCMLAGALTVSEASIVANSDTLTLALRQTLDKLKNYQASTLPYNYVIELARWERRE